MGKLQSFLISWKDIRIDDIKSLRIFHSSYQLKRVHYDGNNFSGLEERRIFLENCKFVQTQSLSFNIDSMTFYVERKLTLRNILNCLNHGMFFLRAGNVPMEIKYEYIIMCEKELTKPKKVACPPGTNFTTNQIMLEWKKIVKTLKKSWKVDWLGHHEMMSDVIFSDQLVPLSTQQNYRLCEVCKFENQKLPRHIGDLKKNVRLVICLCNLRTS